MLGDDYDRATVGVCCSIHNKHEKKKHATTSHQKHCVFSCTLTQTLFFRTPNVDKVKTMQSADNADNADIETGIRPGVMNEFEVVLL